MNNLSRSLSEKIKVVLADDHIAMRIGVASAINNNPDMEVIAEAENGVELLALLDDHHPDVIIMDLRMPEQSGVQTIQLLKNGRSRINILVYSSYTNGEEIFNAFQAGADGFVVKNMSLEVLLEAIRSVAKGERFVPPEISSRMIFRITSNLTDKEITILKLVANGLTNKDIADKLGLVEGTIKVHLSHVFRKLKVNDRTQAVMYALKNHLIQSNW